MLVAINVVVYLLEIRHGVEIPAVFLLAFWFAEQLYLAASGLAGAGGLPSNEGVAYFAHVGGFAFGLLLIRLFVRRKRGSPSAPQPPLPVY